MQMSNLKPPEFCPGPGRFGTCMALGVQGFLLTELLRSLLLNSPPLRDRLGYAWLSIYQ
jgi:hypothetical protein